MTKATLTPTDTGCKLINRAELQRLLGCPKERVDGFIRLHRKHFLDLNPGGKRRFLVISRMKLDAILSGEIGPDEPVEVPTNHPTRRPRKPAKQYV